MKLKRLMREDIGIAALDERTFRKRNWEFEP